MLFSIGAILGLFDQSIVGFQQWHIPRTDGIWQVPLFPYAIDDTAEGDLT